VNPHAAPVARAGAGLAPHGFVKLDVLGVFQPRPAKPLPPIEHLQFFKLLPAEQVFLPAVAAQPPGQALGQDAEEGVGEVQSVKPHVQEPGHGLGSTVGVKG